jgi:transforming growth factor-beta-induced protein
VIRRTFCAAALVVCFASHAPAAEPARADILTTAARAGQFKTLVTAVVAANLDAALKGDGHFTVFAPTDDAFAKLPKGTLETLLKPENQEKLATILKYHVLPKSLLVAAEPPAHRVERAATLAGPELQFTRTGNTLKVNGATVTVRNIECTNGVIQVIDAVLLPPEPEKKPNLIALAEKAGNFKTLLAALKAADLTGALTGTDLFTVFAPTDEAFAKLPKGTVESLLKPENKDKLRAILLYHVVSGSVTARDAVASGTAGTAQGGQVTVGIVKGRLTVNDATATATDLMATNGVIHAIDRVLLPK